jgi:hypothetical protein
MRKQETRHNDNTHIIMIMNNHDTSINVPLQEAITETAKAKNIVIFTGAGMSADSGVGTFRGQGGAWSGVFGTLALIYGGTSFIALLVKEGLFTIITMPLLLA